jgi:hypothetical protein
MQSIHHRIASVAALIMTAALGVGPAVAETANVKVPFSFNVAGETFPAGYYWIQRDDLRDFVTLAAKGSSQHFTCLIGPGTPSPSQYKVALNFDQVGQTHLLQSIQYGTLISRRLDKKALESERASVARSGGR